MQRAGSPAPTVSSGWAQTVRRSGETASASASISRRRRPGSGSSQAKPAAARVAFRLAVEGGEGDDAFVGRAPQRFRQPAGGLDMVMGRRQDRVVAPDDASRAVARGKRMGGLHGAPGRGHRGLEPPSVAGDRELHGERPLQPCQDRHERDRIAGPEDIGGDGFGPEVHPVGGTGPRVADQRIAGGQAPREPVAVKGGNVRAVACRNDSPLSLFRPNLHFLPHLGPDGRVL